jgi:hypothetical protein
MVIFSVFSARFPVSYPCDNSNGPFLELKNYTAVMGVPPEYYSIGHNGMEGLQ